MKRSTVIGLGLVFLTLLGLGMIRLTARHDIEPVLRIGVLKGGTRPIIEAAGVLKGAPYRIEWVDFAAGQPMLEAMGSGAIDVGTTGDTAFQYAYQAGRPLSVILAERAEDVPGASGIVVPENSSIRSAADLKGHVIGTTRGSAGHFLILRALAAAHLTPDDIHFAFLTPADAKAALQSGSIEGWATWPPYIGAAITEKSARIAVDANGLIRNYLFQVASREAVETKKLLLVDFLKRHQVARRWVAQHPGQAAAALARDGGLPLAVARYTLDKQHWHTVPLDQDLKDYQRGLADALGKAGVLAITHDVGAGFRPL